ncbi:MAG: TIGR02710 family CRISPR-associated CARF protein [Candidatus Omnitrophica bacterium]|nr:TIGR02710 family CRISPR-associated CARF protein [Candidatus Omnitrophota bacterium]MCM8788409.1 TIGR02710 family CRISPR-associated CARF protein [Candidatus Omnitrophota bacterium]
MSKAMIVTVGTGKYRKDIASAICKSIDHHNPEEIIFVCSEKSETETMPYIQCDGKIKNKKYSCELLSDENDLEKIQFECGIIIKKVLTIWTPDEIIVDYTSGTKAMSAGLILSAIENGIGSISYIAGERNSEGRVISGKERIISFYPNEIYARKLFSEAIRSFNRYRYDLAIQLLGRARELLREEKFCEKINFLMDLAKAYYFWDRFELKEAFDLLRNLSESSLCSEWGIKNKVGLHTQIVHEENKNKFCEKRIADLFLNARRRHEEKKYDDAVARLYRLLEYIAQFQIASMGLYHQENNGFDTNKLALNKIPENLRVKYSEMIGLEKSYELLNDLGDRLGTKIYSELKKKNSDLKKLLSIRNNSILAHGFSPVTEEISAKLLDVIKGMISEIFPIFDSLLKKIDFPEIKI